MQAKAPFSSALTILQAMIYINLGIYKNMIVAASQDAEEQTFC